jgi:predicted Zn-ribbon and HTH transcriptional regulator
MKKLFDYCCKNCWHTWKSYKKVDTCPKCKSKNINEEYDLMVSE